MYNETMNEKQFQTQLLDWYRKNCRTLPFRQSKNPYHIWISEIMAQQTRIEAMIPYFERFILRLPTLQSLAEVNDEKLHKLWEGLGYYSRAKNLKKCANECMELYGGQLPNTKEELVKLPGIGPYTAGAIASIAFGQVVSAVDGNVIRVFTRLSDNHNDMTKAKNKKEIEKLVDASLPGSEDISDYNQALMELGALVCTPQSPKCQSCPVKSHCQTKDAQQLPNIPKKTKRRVEKKSIYVLVSQDRIHIVQRENKGLLAGLYGFDEICPKDYNRKEKLEPYTHVFSHVQWEMDGTIVWMDKAGKNYYSLEEIKESFAIPSAFQPFLKQIERKLYEGSSD